jgi:hypothetical protein
MRACEIKGPNYPDGITEWECRTHNVECELRDPSRYGQRREDFYCPVGEPRLQPVCMATACGCIGEAHP